MAKRTCCNDLIGHNADILHQAQQGSRVANLTEARTRHWTLPQNGELRHNLYQPPVQVMPDVRRTVWNLFDNWIDCVGSRNAHHFNNLM